MTSSLMIEAFANYGIEPVEEKKFMSDNSEKYKFRIYQYKIKDSSTPIIISILGSGAINLPTNKDVVECIKEMVKD